MANDILAKLAVEINAKTQQFSASLTNLGGQLNKFGKSVEKQDTTLGSLEKTFSGVTTAVKTFAASFLAIGIGNALGQITEVTAKYQRFGAVLQNALGSRSASLAALNELKDFAAKTPFQVDEVTASFVKLVNQGFKPTREQLVSLGDLAASQGKSFDQLTEAIIDAQTGEFERLKEFGIRAKKEGDKVTFTFKGVKEQVDFTADSIRKYILSLGSAAGVSGTMSAVSETIGGKISNLRDNLDQITASLGDRSSGVIGGFLDFANNALGNLNEALNDQVGALKKEQTELNVLVGAITDVNIPTEVRKKLIEELNQKYPDFLRNLNIEKVTNSELEKRLRDVNEQFERKILLVASEKELAKSAERVVELVSEEIKLRKELQNVRRAKLSNEFEEEGLASTESLTALKEAQIAEVQEKRAKVQEELTQLTKEYNVALGVFNSNTNDYFDSGSIDTAVDKVKKAVSDLSNFKPVQVPVEFGNIQINTKELQDSLKRINEIANQTIEPIQVEIDAEQIDAGAEAVIERLAGFQERIMAIQQQSSELLRSIVQDSVIALAEDVGGALVGVQDFGQGFLKAVAGFAKQFGVLMIAAGFARTKFDQIKFAGSGPLLIAAGGLLVAAASAVSGHLSKATNIGGDSVGGSVAGATAGNRNTISQQGLRVEFGKAEFSFNGREMVASLKAYQKAIDIIGG